MLSQLLKVLELPETRDLPTLDSASTSLIHRRIILQKPFLKKLYDEFYGQFLAAVGHAPQGKTMLELGSGGGFLKDRIPNVTTSDIMKLPHVDMIFSAFEMPFPDRHFDAIFGLDILHHLNDIHRFLSEMDRTLKVGGKAVFIEPANTLWGRFIYTHFHHEPFDPAGSWTFEGSGPLSSANGALPWIVFVRDRARFDKDFPNLKITRIRHHTPFLYLLSGGVSYRQLLPSFSYPFVRALEAALLPFAGLLGMFMTIEVEKT